MCGKIDIEVIGVDPPCKRCATTQKNAEQAIAILKAEGLKVTLKKLNITSKDVVSRYGFIPSPAVAVNGQVRVAGRIPSPSEIAKVIREGRLAASSQSE